MKKLVPLALAAAAVGVFASVRAESQGQSPYQLGFVDVRKVLNDYRKREIVEKDIASKTDQFERQVKDQRAAIEGKRDKLQTLNPDSDEYAQLDREITFDMTRFKSDGEWQGRRLERERNTRFAMLYTEIQYEIRLQAEQRGLAAVLVTDPLPTGWEKNTDFVGVLRGRHVLYSDARLDLTKAITDSLNAKLPPAPSAPPK